MEYFLNPSNNQVYAYDPATQQELIDEAIANGWTQVTDWPLPPPPPTAEENKQTASSKLYSTDWTTIPDVADSTKSNPYLVNVSDFISYRNAVRLYAVNPVAGNINWPTEPKATWS